MCVDKGVMFFDSDVGKKIYQFENNITYVTRHQVVASTEEEAFNVYLEQREVKLKCEDNTNCVCSYVKDYSELGPTKIVGTVKYNSEDEEVYVE